MNFQKKTAEDLREIEDAKQIKKSILEFNVEKWC